MKKYLLIILLGILSHISTFGQLTFTVNDDDFYDVLQSDAAWADVDRDGDLDAVVLGTADNVNPQTRFYRNLNEEGNSEFVLEQMPLVDLKEGAVVFGDLDADGFPDLVLTGEGEQGSFVTAVYKNEGGTTFLLQNTDIIQVSASSVCLGDFDEDMDLDIAIMGRYEIGTFFETTTRIYRNNGNFIFDEVDDAFDNTDPGFSEGDLAWEPKAGFLALLGTSTANERTAIYRSLGNGRFTSFSDLLPAKSGSIVWADFDKDGFVDLAYTGLEAFVDEPVTVVYQNIEDLAFDEKVHNIPPLSNSRITSADFTGNGLPDIGIMGRDQQNNLHTGIYRNDNNFSFSLLPSNLAATTSGSIFFVDANKDNYLDVFLTGGIALGPQSALYTNEMGIYAQASPTEICLNDPPPSLNISFNRSNTLSWGANDSLFLFQKVGNGPFLYTGIFAVDKNGSFTIPYNSPSYPTPAATYRYRLVDRYGMTSAELEVNSRLQNNPLNLFAPPIDSICKGDSILIAQSWGAQSAMQWLLDGEPIAAATDSILWAKATGTYTVEVVAGACKAESTDSYYLYVKDYPITISLDSAGICEDLLGQNQAVWGSRIFLSPSRQAAVYRWIIQDSLYGNSELFTPLTPYYASSLDIILQAEIEGCSVADTLSLETIPKPPGCFELIVFPNPNKGQFYINLELPLFETLEATLVNGLGQVVYAKQYQDLPLGFTRLELNTVGLASGVYFLFFKGDGHYFDPSKNIQGRLSKLAGFPYLKVLVLE